MHQAAILRLLLGELEASNDSLVGNRDQSVHVGVASELQILPNLSGIDVVAADLYLDKAAPGLAPTPCHHEESVGAQRQRRRLSVVDVRNFRIASDLAGGASCQLDDRATKLG